MFKDLFANNIDLLRIVTNAGHYHGEALVVERQNKKLQQLQTHFSQFLQERNQQTLAAHVFQQILSSVSYQAEDIIDLMINLCQSNNEGVSFVQQHIHELLFEGERPLRSILTEFIV
jgi:cupin superfamily acireductone dioxygenase involved in methionine salvage